MTGDMDEIDQFLAEEMANLDLSKLEKFAKKGGDALFGRIEELQIESGEPSFGDLLDAGTGSHSLRWMASVFHRERLEPTVKLDKGELPATDGEERVRINAYTAVTADEKMRKRVLEEAFDLGISARGDVVIGDWARGVGEDGGVDPRAPPGARLLEGRMFDTIVADYLVGAIDGFAPYFQDLVFPRLVEHLKPGGRMYVIGLNPIPDRVRGDANVFCKITKIRDSCILLANHRCYREYPIEWIMRNVKRAGLEVVDAHRYPIRYDHATMVRQINVARSKLPHFISRGMANEMKKVLDGLEKESFEVTQRRPDGRITMGFDYIITAERPIEDSTEQTEEKPSDSS